MVHAVCQGPSAQARGGTGAFRRLKSQQGIAWKTADESRQTGSQGAKGSRGACELRGSGCRRRREALGCTAPRLCPHQAGRRPPRSTALPARPGEGSPPGDLPFLPQPQAQVPPRNLLAPGSRGDEAPLQHPRTSSDFPGSGCSWAPLPGPQAELCLPRRWCWQSAHPTFPLDGQAVAAGTHGT